MFLVIKVITFSKDLVFSPFSNSNVLSLAHAVPKRETITISKWTTAAHNEYCVGRTEEIVANLIDDVTFYELTASLDNGGKSGARRLLAYFV